MCQNGVRTKETQADIAEQVFFFEGQPELKTGNVFLNQHLKIYYFTLF